MNNKVTSIIENMRDVEKMNINLTFDRLKHLCEQDSDLCKLIELIYSNYEEETLNYYKHKGICQFLKSVNCVYTNADRNDNTRCNLIEEILMFIDTFIHTEYTDSINELYNYNYYGVMITVEKDNIKLNYNNFENEEKMHAEGYHNDVKYYLDNLKKYANNCLNKNKEK